MFKQSFIASLILLTSLSFAGSTALAEEFDIVRIQNVLKENTPMDSEKKAANVLIAYSDLMTYLSSDLISGLVTSTKKILPDVDSMLKQTSGRSDPQLLEALDKLKTAVATLVEGTNQNNLAVQNLSQQVLALNKAKEKYPQAQFVSTLDLLISLTKEFALDHANFTLDMNRYVTQMSDIQKLINENSVETSAGIEQLAATKDQVEKYSFVQLGERFNGIKTVLKMMYQE